MANIIQVIKNIPDLLQLKPASQSQIRDAELQLKITFAHEYKEYLASFGAIMADGIELSGIANAEHRNVIHLTQTEWLLNPQIPHTMYVVENTCVDGIIIWQDAKGYIYKSTPNSTPKKIAKSLSEYILMRIK